MRLEHFISGNDQLQRHLAAERAKEALIVVSPFARDAVEKEILPQLEESVTSVSACEELGASTKSAIADAFKSKTPAYTRLITYKSIDQSDGQFLEDLLRVMDEWETKTKGTLRNDSSESNQIDIKIHLDGGDVDKVTATIPEDESLPKNADEQVSQNSPQDFLSSKDSGTTFDFNDVRL